MNRRKLDALIALSRDPGATEAERRLAAEHVARLRGNSTATDFTSAIEVEMDDELADAVDRAVARAMTVRSSSFRAARLRAAEHRLGRGVVKQWQDGRGPGLPR